MNKEEALKQFKSMFPEDIEAVVLTKENYDNYLGIKEYENIQLKQIIEELELENKCLNKKIDTAIEYIEKNIVEDAEYEGYMQCRATEKEKLLNILKGEE